MPYRLCCLASEILLLVKDGQFSGQGWAPKIMCVKARVDDVASAFDATKRHRKSS